MTDQTMARLPKPRVRKRTWLMLGLAGLLAKLFVAAGFLFLLGGH